jgi:bifunctional N-acetylglucosamine-1-phosphate-uridyltransferase/glucosamine-1-phosphate-acetyltransferase GlmU-like protein
MTSPLSPSDLHPLFEALPEPLAPHFDPARPWELLGEPLEAALAALPSSDLRSALGPGVHLLGDRIAIGKGVRILPGAVLEGPIRIGDDTLIRPGAYLRGGVWIGRGCVIGANTEIKRAILLDGAKAPHLNYVGDSVLGAEVNLGAGTILSNFRFDGAEIRIPADGGRLSTGRRKLGAVLGDRAQTGCNCVLFPGSVVGAGAWVGPGVELPAGLYAPGVRIRKAPDFELAPGGPSSRRA